MKIVVHDFFSLFRPVLHYQNARTPNRIGQIIFSNRVVWPSWWSRFCRKYDFFHYIFFFPKNSQTLSPSQEFFTKSTNSTKIANASIFLKNCKETKNFAKKQKNLQKSKKLCKVCKKIQSTKKYFVWTWSFFFHFFLFYREASIVKKK